MSRNFHHLYFPRRAYLTPLERQFRQHPDNVVEMDADAHRLLHDCSTAPQKPAPAVMHRFLQQRQEQPQEQLR